MIAKFRTEKKFLINKKEMQTFQNSSFQHFQKEVFCFPGLGSKSTLKNIPFKKPKATYQQNANQPEMKMMTYSP